MIYLYLTNLFCLIVSSILLEKYLHLFQLKDYKNVRFFRFLIKKSYYFAIILIFFVVFLINYLFFHNNLIININSNLLLIFIISLFSIHLVNSNKTPIKYTPRVRRLYIISIILLLLINAVPYGVIISCLALPFIPIMANMINFYDRFKNKKFIEMAKLKLRLNRTRIIAITGSNGKTSVKNILYTMLNKKYITQMTPKSYNTELGISKFINKELQNNCEFLILEYGARNIGDIKKLCKLFGVDFGIITSVAPQHLETFKNIENVYQTKKELSDHLGADLCIYNLDNKYTKIMYQDKIGKKQGISIQSRCEIYANNIRIEEYRTCFYLHINNQSIPITTKLLGRHNVTNILLASALAINLNISIEDIVNAIRELEPVPHRLELTKTHINILDDTYNCSIESAREAIWTLNQIPGSHIVATPGIIEGGKEQYNINYKLGEILSDVDSVIIIGKTNLEAIKSGLTNKKFNKSLIIVNDLEDAKSHFSKLKRGDTLLLLNDLPDDYN